MPKTPAPTLIEDLVEDLMVAVRKFTTGSVQHDDITVMVLRYLG